jgi:transposase
MMFVKSVVHARPFLPPARRGGSDEWFVSRLANDGCLVSGHGYRHRDLLRSDDAANRLRQLKQFPVYLNRWDSQQARNEGVFGIDSPFMGALMPKAYSRDLRERVITAVETGASRREAAERFEVSVASAVKWLQRWYQQRSAAPKPRGGSISPLEEFSGEILDLIARQPDLTLVETVAELRKRRIKTSRSSLWRFLDRHNITLKKSPASSRTAASRCGAGAPPVDTRARYA